MNNENKKLILLQPLEITQNKNIELLYLRKNNKDILTNDNKIIFKNNGKISFDTYFNIFSFRKWKRYTNITNLIIKIIFKGSFEVRIFDINYKCETKELYKSKFFSKKNNSIKIPIIYKQNYSNIYIQLVSLKNNSTIYVNNSGYFTYSDIRLRPIKLAIGICTYKREKYILENISKFILLNSKLKDKINIFISDTAGSLPVINNSQIHISKINNVGGSGGFTHSLLEILDFKKKYDNNISHIILMDDDVLINVTSILRTIYFLRVIKDDYLNDFIGGAMLNISNPCIQFVNGEKYNFERYENFIKRYNQNVDLRKLKNVVKNNNINDANYQGWWFCCMPISKIDYNNLPFPFFIKIDDIEYGLRNTEHVIMLNGINVWHESFESKYNSSTEYYWHRNLLIALSSHNLIKLNKLLKMYLKTYYRLLHNYKYSEVSFLNKAIIDFLKGYKYFSNLDSAFEHKRIISNSTKLEEINLDDYRKYKKKYYEDKNKIINLNFLKRFIRYITLNGLFSRKKDYTVLSVYGGVSCQTYKKNKLIFIDLDSNKIICAHKNISLSLKLLFKSWLTILLIIFKFHSSKKSYKNNWKKIVTYDSWKKKILKIT